MAEASAKNGAPQRTPLYDLHSALGARIVEFAGYSMPLQYPTGILKEHTQTRTRAGLFDVSHMGQVRVSGRGAAAALESLLPIDVVDLPRGQQRYGFFTNAQGGILDDLMVTRLDDSFLLVVNAAGKTADIEHLRKQLGNTCTIDVLGDRALLALQGPAAAKVLGALAPQATALAFMQATEINLLGTTCYVSRSGYTGEDGFEISVPASRAEALARELLRDADVAPIGLGARDSLRLEAGLCLYGHDLDATTTPVEASLTWALSKARRTGGARAGGYPGAEIVLAQLKIGAVRQRVGLSPRSRIPVRAGAEIYDPAGARVGIVTSGGFGPTLGAPVAMGYVATAAAVLGKRLEAVVRGERVPLEVANMPAVPHRYLRR
jgi:aminomethyltransferase